MSPSPMHPDAFIRRAIAHLPALLRAGRMLTGRPSDAEDLAQETLMRAVEKRDALEDPARLKSWLLTIQRNLHLNNTRGLRPKLEVLEGGLGHSEVRRDEPFVAPAQIEAEAIGDELQAALDALPPEWREALWLREVEELSYEEIAQIQHCPLGTVRSRLARARGAVLDAMQTQGKKEAGDGGM